VGYIQQHKAFWKMRPDQRIVVMGEWPTPDQRLATAERILIELARLAKAA
jgi:transcription-repair coupling factor (superfamily II helicase)